MIELVLCVGFMFCLTLLGVKLAVGVGKFFWGNIGAICLVLGFILMCLMLKVGG